MSMLHPYEDRKRMKWMGYYLSEHTTQINQNEAQEQKVIVPKTMMNETEISEILSYAIIKTKPVAIQKNERNYNQYLPDITGFIQSYNKTGILVNNQKILYQEIRHVEIDTTQKWSSL